MCNEKKSLKACRGKAETEKGRKIIKWWWKRRRTVQRITWQKERNIFQLSRDISIKSFWHEYAQIKKTEARAGALWLWEMTHD